MRRTLGLLATTAALAGGTLALAPSASAHATLLKVSPADGATLTTAPRQVDLTFDEPVSSRFATVVITGPSGEDATAGPATVNGAHVAAALAGGLASGEYRVAFRVVSDDGHPVTGQSRFTLNLPAAGPSPRAPAPSASPLAAPSTAAAPASLAGDGSSWVTQHLPALSGALLLVVVGAGALVWDRRRG
ncbi:copper resistance CopC family protein [Oryzihumus leptocrescens]|uniref:copper resistance CopC family protein n=1 Tax=Oryzihumus leptocrescens TaxID=297536 RepID=UPI00163959AC|nr:copper resistance CopC family protein [Oryzihumus leptocrescens]